jgi:hypothetical protein
VSKSTILFLTFWLLFSFSARSEVTHNLIRRVAVFPVADANVSNNEDAWWQMREVLTKDQRFFAASRRFMVNRGVFQPRKDLKPADAIILSKILDAQALVVSYLQERTLHMRVYDGENGYLLWQGDAEFHPAIPINDQLVKMSSELVRSFILAIPYQGFQVLNEATGKAIVEDDAKKLAVIDVGANSQVQVGDPAQWISVTGNPGQAFFSGNAKVTVIAEGTVKSIKGDKATVLIEKLTDPADIKENSLVRFPKEINRLKDLYVQGDKASNLSAEYLSSEIKSVDEFNTDHNSTSTALAWIVNVAGFILLAF